MLNNIVVADTTGKELRMLVFDSYDFEVGHAANDFQITIKREEYEYMPEKARLYIPGTELGGLFRQLYTDTEHNTISPGGITWRGMMQKKIIQPASGQDYATDSGELNAIIKSRVEAAFPGLFAGVSDSTGVTVNWQYARYCTMEEGLKDLLQSVGYRLDLSYSQADAQVIAKAVPIIDYSSSIEFSSDMRVNYQMQQQGDGVNHLICLGKGELRNRVVRHLYIDGNGNIGTTQYYFGVDEVAEVYDSGGSEVNDLVKNGKERLKSVANKDVFNIKVDPEVEIAIGDIVGGRDYLSGMTMAAPVYSKIVKFNSGMAAIDYTLETDRMTVEDDEDALQSVQSLQTDALQTDALQSVQPINDLQTDALQSVEIEKPSLDMQKGLEA